MPVAELLEGVVGSVLRVIGQVLVEWVFEILVRGTGYWLLKIITLNQLKLDIESTRVAVVGLLFWFAMAILVWQWLY